MLDMLMGGQQAGSVAGAAGVSLGWVAGFFDGEGCVYISTQTKGDKLPQCGLSVILANTDRRSLEAIRSLFPAPIRLCSRVKQRKQQYEWRLHGAAAQHFCKMILPYSVIKKEQLELAIAFFGLPWRRRSNKNTWKERTKDQVVVDLKYAKRMAEMKHVAAG